MEIPKMTTKVFIDGRAGTTGLRIYDRLLERSDVTLLTLAEEDRKDPAKRKEMLNSCDIAFLCLPDDASREAVSMIENPAVAVLDTSTAHRTLDDWAYGFPELSPEFFRKADALLDEAEKLAGNDRRILYAVQDERLPLDAVRVYNYDQMKVPLDRKALQDRYFSVKQRMGEEEGYYNFKTDIHHSFITCGGIASEKAVFQAPVPEQFRGRKIFSWFAVSEKRARDKVKDPEAAGGIAVKLGKEPYQPRLRMKLYDTREEKNLHDEFVLTSFPEDEKYHWYYIHTADLYGHIIFWTNLFQNNLSWAIVPPPQNRMEIYVSLKFTGPTFVPGSKKPNGIFLDRIIATPPRQK